jgi:GntR family transcriptional regulator
MARYERIATDLRTKISNGDLGPGEKLPAETALAGDYNVSVPTIRQAIGVLRGEGLIESRHGMGTFVRAPRRRVRRTPERYQWEKDRVKQPQEQRAETGATERDTGLEMADLEFSATYETITADESLARDFAVPVDTRVLQRSYRTKSRHEAAPISLIRSYLVYDHVAANPALLDAKNEPWPGGTQHQLSTVGIELDEITDEITARPPLVDESEALGIDPVGTAVLVLKRVSIDTGGRVVEISHVILPGDRTEFFYRTKLDRWR